MKDYTLNKTKNFILFYKIKNDNIIVRLNNNQKTIIFYSKENEEKIQSLMKKQLTNVTDKHILDLAFQKNKCLWLRNYCIVLTLIFSLFTLISSFFGTSLYLSIGLITFIPTIIYNTIKSKKLDNIINDYLKNKFFITNQEELKNYNNDKEKVLENTSKKTKNIIKENINNTPNINISSIAKVSLTDLKILKENLIKYKNLTDQKVDKGFTYTKKQVRN